MGAAYFMQQKPKRDLAPATKKKTIQLKSELRYKPCILKCKDPDDPDKIIETPVGIDSDVFIDGSGVTTGSQPYPERNGIYFHLENYVKGHIVNQNLGGPGISQNLFPFSAGTNRHHEHNIERYAKSMYSKFLTNHIPDENFYYHCWLTGNALSKECLDEPKDVNEIEINGTWYIINRKTGKKRAVDAKETTTFDPDPDYTP